ncbi:uncharacterized protein LOC126983566 [Eriocheir sinensis]|uniref:uncharacterized protein LOC126983566 n=1 Tax=Eriocheir sinensis TaxID=95602 RepID=UPI0021C78821|nr:uncharacterized protein LOC126983566 [Eriocheir sinensis]XP_050692321.1 uncharacterized protein LOC126983566 [Eriocheir sinensis]
MHLLINLLLTCIGAGPAAGVRILRLSVPPAVKAESGPALLDCVYVLGAGQGEAATGDAANWTTDGLVIKWYIDNLPVYQWIPPGRPQAMGVLAGRVDPSYRASPHPWDAHRALYIPRPLPALSGRYTCTVSTFENEHTRSAPLLVWREARRISLNYWRPSEHLLNVTCTADEVAPRPALTLYTLPPEGPRQEVKAVGVLGPRGEGGWWWVGSWGLLPYASTPPNTTLGCSLTLPGAPPDLPPQTCEEVYDNDLPIITTTTTTTTTASPQLRDRWTNKSTGSSSSSPVNESFFAIATRVPLSPALVCLATLIVSSSWSLLLAATL